MNNISKAALIKVAIRIFGWALIGFLAAVGLPTETITEVVNAIGVGESGVIVSAIALFVVNAGFYAKDKLAKGET